MQKRQITSQRRHHANAVVGVAETGVNVQTAIDGATHAFLEDHRKVTVAVSLRGHLLLPAPERVRRHGNHLGTVLPGRVRHKLARLAQRLTHFSYRVAYSGIGFDLRAKKLVNHLVRARVSLA